MELKVETELEKLRKIQSYMIEIKDRCFGKWDYARNITKPNKPNGKKDNRLSDEYHIGAGYLASIFLSAGFMDVRGDSTYTLEYIWSGNDEVTLIDVLDLKEVYHINDKNTAAFREFKAKQKLQFGGDWEESLTEEEIASGYNFFKKIDYKLDDKINKIKEKYIVKREFYSDESNFVVDVPVIEKVVNTKNETVKEKTDKYSVLLEYHKNNEIKLNDLSKKINKILELFGEKTL